MATSIPRHVGIIMDGNRRWARARGLAPMAGHRAGYETLKRIGTACLDRGVEYLTVFGFSTENWQRAKREVSFLLALFEFGLTKELEHFQQQGTRLNVIGRIQEFPPRLQRAIRQAMYATRRNTRGVLTLALNYGGRQEILDAVARLVRINASSRQLTPRRFAAALYDPTLPAPDLIIRTSGEQRMSGFLTWQAAYSELYFTKVHWPAFTTRHLDAALRDYANRQRRFGT